MLPCVAEIHVMAKRHDAPAFVVVDASPVRDLTRFPLLISQPGFEKLGPRNLESIVEIVKNVEDRVAVFDIDNRTIREDLVHAVDESLPFLNAVEIVHHQETAPKEVLAQLLCIGIS